MQVYRRDLYSGTTTLVSQNRFLTGPANWDVDNHSTWASADGKTVAFFTAADDVIEGDDNSEGDVFVWTEGLVPRLSVTLAEDQITLSWLRALDRFKLESTSSLGEASAWPVYDGVINSAGASNLVTITTTPGEFQRFFRLRQH